jgi:hypothetical protein
VHQFQPDPRRSRSAMALCLVAFALSIVRGLAQESAPSPPSAKPTEHVLGTITAVDASAGIITVKDDKTGTEHQISVAETHTLLKVEPGAKDLKNATRITAGDLVAGDRVDVRGFSANGAASINARSVVLMSARDLQQKRQTEMAAWQNSIAGTVRLVDATGGVINITVKTPEGSKPVAIQTSASTEFTRYAPATPKTPVSHNSGTSSPQIRCA